MKPVIIYINKNEYNDGKITITKQKFEDVIESAYRQGYADGQKSNWYSPYRTLGSTLDHTVLTTNDVYRNGIQYNAANSFPCTELNSTCELSGAVSTEKSDSNIEIKYDANIEIE